LLYEENRTRTSDFGLKIPEEPFMFTHLEFRRLSYSDSSHRAVDGDGRIYEKRVLSERLSEEEKSTRRRES
jgi:hypothetical protein